MFKGIYPLSHCKGMWNKEELKVWFENILLPSILPTFGDASGNNSSAFLGEKYCLGIVPPLGLDFDLICACMTKRPRNDVVSFKFLYWLAFSFFFFFRTLFLFVSLFIFIFYIIYCILLPFFLILYFSFLSSSILRVFLVFPFFILLFFFF